MTPFRANFVLGPVMDKPTWVPDENGRYLVSEDIDGRIKIELFNIEEHELQNSTTGSLPV